MQDWTEVLYKTGIKHDCKNRNLYEWFVGEVD